MPVQIIVGEYALCREAFQSGTSLSSAANADFAGGAAKHLDFTSMPYPFMLSYAHKDATIGGEPPQPDPHFDAFVKRLSLRVGQLTGSAGFVDHADILPGADWPDDLAEAVRTASTMVCLYSPSYFQSEYCGKEMQAFLDRRQNYIRANAGKKPANIIPVLWQPVTRRVPKTLPDIQYKNAKLNPDTQGVWNLGDQGQERDLNDIADQIALRVRDAADLTPLPVLPGASRIKAFRSAFLPPPLPLPEFDSPDATGGPDAVTFVYASSTHWNAWPWAPPEEQAVLYLAAAVAKGAEMASTQLTFDLADANLIDRLTALRRSNNVVIFLVDAASLGLEGLRARMQDFDRPEHSCFSMIVLDNRRNLPVSLDDVFPYFAKRTPPHFHMVQPRENPIETRERFSKTIADALEQLRLVVINNPYAPNVIGNRTGFQSLPAVDGPGRPS